MTGFRLPSSWRPFLPREKRRPAISDTEEQALGSTITAGFLRFNYVWMGALLGVVFWIIEAIIHVVIFKQGTIYSEMWTTDRHEMWKRVLVAGLLFAFGLFAQHGINIRRRTEEALKTSEQKYRTLITEALNPIFVFDEWGNFVDFNQATLLFFECDAENFLSSRFQNLTRSDGQPVWVQSGIIEPDIGEVEVQWRTDCITKTLLLNIAPVQISGSSQLYYGIGQDITDRKLAERNLGLAHEELNQIFQTASSAMRLVDKEGNVLKVNQTFADLSGISREVAVGAKCYEVFAGEQCHTESCPLTQILDGVEEVEYEITKERADGMNVSCLLTARPFVGPDGDLVGIVESFKDITDIARMQEELRTERDRLRNILFQQFEGVGIVRLDHTIEFQNAAWKKEFGDCHGRKCYNVLRSRAQPCDSCLMQAAIASGETQQCEYEVSGGRVFAHTYTPLGDAGTTQKVLILLRDITERKASRAAVIRSEQLAALGELAAGVAHEINNPINGIINYAQMLINSHPGGGKVPDIATRIVTEGDRVAQIVESLLTFARRDSRQRSAVSIPEILTDSLTLISAQLRKDAITLRMAIPVDLPKVFCVPQEIQQVFLNVLENARYALNERYPLCHEDKTLEIEATTAEGVGEGQVVVSIADHGIGIPQDVVNKVMNPFFSTKPKGEGTGLGLSISHAIVSENGGRLAIESAEGEFTRVSVQLPEMVT